VSARLAVVVSGFPRTSETFAVGELAALAGAGRLVRIYATKAGDGAVPQPGVEPLLPLVRMLPPGDADAQAAALLADLDGEQVDGVHGYFAHQPAAVAERAAAGLGVDFSFSVHALDARKVPAAELARRSRAAAGVIACNADVATHVDVPGARVATLPHGVDLGRFQPRPHPAGDGRLRVLAVGRLVEKKGFPVLLEALARLDVPWVLRIVGTGPESGGLEKRVAELGIADRVTLVGRRSHHELPAELAWADVVAVPSVVDSSGDRDGLPNVVLEGMASGRPLVVSDVAAIAATVTEGRAGIVVPPRDALALTTALRRLASPDLRAELGRHGRHHVEAHFNLPGCTRTLVDHLEVLHARSTEPVDA